MSELLALQIAQLLMGAGGLYDYYEVVAINAVLRALSLQTERPC